MNQDNPPRRFRVRLTDGSKHPSGRAVPFVYGCYFPQTDLYVNDMGIHRTGEPKGVEWLDREGDVTIPLSRHTEESYKDLV